MGGKIERQKIIGRARPIDIKFFLRKHFGVGVDQAYIRRINHRDWGGWVIEFDIDADLAELQRNIWGCIRLGDRAVYIEAWRGWL